MGEQAAKIGKKLEGFGVNFFANLGWTELTQDKEIKCTRSSHKKKTHGIDLLCKFTNPYIAGNQGIVVFLKSTSTGSGADWAHSMLLINSFTHSSIVARVIEPI